MELYWDDDDTDRDGAEVLVLLQEAAGYFDLWLDRIRDEDVQEAISKMALQQGKSIKVYDSFAAGFVPPPAP